jgi:acyl carrier protein
MGGTSDLDDSARDGVPFRVRQIVARALELDVEEVQMDSSLFALGAESLDLVDMAFMIEAEYQIQFPRTDFLERAGEHLDAEELVVNGVITELGLDLLRLGMPELDPAVIKPGLRDIDFAQMITVESFARITQRLLDAKAEFSRECPHCGGKLIESAVMPEFDCSNCGETEPLPSGDDILLNDLLQLYQQVQDGT